MIQILCMKPIYICIWGYIWGGCLGRFMSEIFSGRGPGIFQIFFPAGVVSSCFSSVISVYPMR